MEVHVLEEKSEAMKIFDREEWKNYDRVHFGREIEWDTKVYYLKVEDEAEILGTMELKIEAGVGKVQTLLVSSQTQRKGVGTALMLKAEDLTRLNKGHKMYLTTGQDWDAVKFYEAMGFEKTGELKNHYFNIDFVEFSKFI